MQERLTTRWGFTLAPVLVALLWGSPSGAQEPTNQRFDQGVWRIAAPSSAPVSNGLVLRDARLASPTTYVVANRVVVSGRHLTAEDATIYTTRATVRAMTATIDARQDEVTFTPRVRGSQE